MVEQENENATKFEFFGGGGVGGAFSWHLMVQGGDLHPPQFHVWPYFVSYLAYQYVFYTVCRHEKTCIRFDF